MHTRHSRVLCYPPGTAGKPRALLPLPPPSPHPHTWGVLRLSQEEHKWRMMSEVTAGCLASWSEHSPAASPDPFCTFTTSRVRSTSPGEGQQPCLTCGNRATALSCSTPSCHARNSPPCLLGQGHVTTAGHLSKQAVTCGHRRNTWGCSPARPGPGGQRDELGDHVPQGLHHPVHTVPPVSGQQQWEAEWGESRKTERFRKWRRKRLGGVQCEAN